MSTIHVHLDMRRSEFAVHANHWQACSLARGAIMLAADHWRTMQCCMSSDGRRAWRHEYRLARRLAWQMHVVGFARPADAAAPANVRRFGLILRETKKRIALGVSSRPARIAA